MRNKKWILLIVAGLAGLAMLLPHQQKTEKPPNVDSAAPAPKAADGEMLARLMQVNYLRKLRDAAKDPSSFVLSSAVDTGKVICVEYRAKNSFGAIVPGYATILATGPSIGPKTYAKYCNGAAGIERARELGRLL